jgi:hypothetical protein
VDFGSIPDALRRLREADPPPQVFGAGLHRFALNPRLPEAEVAAFERAHGIRLPEDYRRFLTEVGNGGAGPHYGLFPLGWHLAMRSLEPWRAGDGSVGIPSQPFRHSRRWNRVAGKPDEDAVPASEYDAAMDEWQVAYFDCRLMDGAVPLANLGCGLSEWLVVTGLEAGTVWGDYRADETGICPLGVGELARVGFAAWYLSWLDEALAALEGRPPALPRPRFMAPREPSLFNGLE